MLKTIIPSVHTSEKKKQTSSLQLTVSPRTTFLKRNPNPRRNPNEKLFDELAGFQLTAKKFFRNFAQSKWKARFGIGANPGQRVGIQKVLAYAYFNGSCSTSSNSQAHRLRRVLSVVRVNGDKHKSTPAAAN